MGLLASDPLSIGQAAVTYGRTTDILTKASGFIGAYDYSLNPYSGCSFGCTYCYAAFFNRTAEQRDYWGYWVRVKANAAATLEKRLNRDSQALDGRRIYMSSVTDPYQPVERSQEITRDLLQVMVDRESTVKLVVQTRSPDVVRDIDLYRQIVENGGRVQINMTITTDDESVRETLEPFCPGNGRRLAAIKAMAEAGLQTCITATPLLWLEDAAAFVKRLRASSVKRFVTQSFHFGRGRFVAMTREQAVDLMARKIGCRREDFQQAYLLHYRRWRKILTDELVADGCTIGEGKEGFAPPF
ncbi:MAG: radical SAM protein [Bacteroidota bacterium]|nr:radical SAM protein [Bacteroidota bacterium]